MGRRLGRPRLSGAHGLAWEVGGRAAPRLLLDAGRATAGVYALAKAEAARLERLRAGEPTAAARHAWLSFRKHADGVRVRALSRHPGERHVLLECDDVVLSLRLWGTPALTLVVAGRAVASLGPGREAWPLPATGRDAASQDVASAGRVPALLASRPLAQLDDALLAEHGVRFATGDPDEAALARTEFASWRQAYARLLELTARGVAFAARRRQALDAARRDSRRLATLEAHLEADRGSLHDAASLRHQAEALLAAPTAVTPGAAEAELPDPYQPGASLRLALDPALDVFANAQRLFEKARRAERGRQRIELRLGETRERLQAARALALRLERARWLADLEGVTPAARPAARAPVRRGGPLHYLTTHGLSLLVGRGARENQRLTFSMAAPDDLWLHARDVPGAHVILRDNEGRASAEDIREAAETAAFFSEAATAAAADVHVARRKHLRPVPGGQGRVRLGHAETLRVAPRDPEGRLRRR